jgi:uncharacterized protein GlcG (DUF336 family)
MDAELPVPADPTPFGGFLLEVELALEYATTARRIGREHGITATVAVHDPGGHPLVVLRGSAAKWHGPYMAMGKARLAAAFQRPTAELCERWESRPFFPMSLTEIIPGGVTVNPGGYPIFVADRCVGAIGVGGGAPGTDDTVARLTVEHMAARLGGATSSVTPPSTSDRTFNGTPDSTSQRSSADAANTGGTR